MKKIIIAFILSAAAFVYSKELQLSVKETTILVDSSEQKRRSKNETIGKKICLGDGYFYTLTEDEKNLYDFKNKKIYYINLKNQTYAEYSLYSGIGFNSAELNNRIWMHDVFEKSMPDSNIYKNLYDMEVVFSIDHPDIAEPQISEEALDDKFIYKINRMVYNEYTVMQDKKLDGYRNILEKFFLYDCGIHPSVRKKILDKNFFFKKFYYKMLDGFFAYDMTFELEKMEEVNEDYNTIPSSFKKIYDTDAELFGIIAALETNPPKQTSLTEYKEMITGLIENKNYFEAVLTCMESLLENNEGFIEELKKILPYSREDKNLALYLKATGLSDEKKYDRALKVYNSISRKNLKRDYNIDIQIAVMQANLGNQKEAVEYYLKALRKNPFITSVYKDLGDIYYGSRDMHFAWVIWDTAKKISPDHPLLNNVYELEKNLEKYHPEFF